jgi:hypothetical protein
VGGIIATGTSSHLLIALLALDAEVHLQLPDPASVSPTVSWIITQVSAAAITGVTALLHRAPGRMARVARTPRDCPSWLPPVTRGDLCAGRWPAWPKPIPNYDAGPAKASSLKKLVDVAVRAVINLCAHLPTLGQRIPA